MITQTKTQKCETKLKPKINWKLQLKNL